MNSNGEVIRSKDQSFRDLNFGTVPTAATTETIQVEINPEIMLMPFAKAYVQELYRRNPIRANEPAAQITVDEMYYYFCGCLRIRVESVDNQCRVWRQAKRLMIPAWIQFALSQVGRVRVPEEGIIFEPKFDFKYEIDRMLSISSKLRMYIPDGIKLFEDAFPRGEEGDIETMSMCLVEHYVMAHKMSHPISSYIAAFLGFKSIGNIADKAFYRIRYDDVEFITSMVIHEGSLF